ncbi:hypothetical protein [Chitinimonas sp. BJB300]|uniref:hypothetical protein n=1 Tax=Chitinimonas sp. BJB300 TaxID=1559339 RepID=UPI000C10A2D7|nr:hypothetical protein [Chitinimonas sp. BJB300]PHV10537.1 hypothetical protein CSQ89_15745 [Chitinimonas sp. BJB300]TSJ85231.1 hypothetical protein FG002_018195 [Chitinimonas sp. BJB300]
MQTLNSSEINLVVGGTGKGTGNAPIVDEILRGIGAEANKQPTVLQKLEAFAEGMRAFQRICVQD